VGETITVAVQADASSTAALLAQVCFPMIFKLLQIATIFEAC
jgi:hypothetical protein